MTEDQHADYERRCKERVERALKSPHHIYRCYDATGRLIYIGRTMNLFTRLDMHRDEAWWADQVVNVKATLIKGVEAASRAETMAIRSENPRWNISRKWFARKRWTEDDFKDFVYSSLRCGYATLKSKRVVAVYDEYERRFGKPLTDPRIDGSAWPTPRWNRGENRRAWIHHIRTRHLVPKSEAAA